jgi:hypothetical protein
MLNVKACETVSSTTSEGPEGRIEALLKFLAKMCASGTWSQEVVHVEPSVHAVTAVLLVKKAAVIW